MAASVKYENHALYREHHHSQILQLIKRRSLVCPPSLGAAGAIDIDNDLFRTATGLAQDLFVGLADLDSEVDGSGQITLPQCWFIFST